MRAAAANPVVLLRDVGKMEELRKGTNGSRTTLRIDIPAHNCEVDTVCAESVAPGIAELKLNSSLNQRSLATVQWLEANRRPLVQNDCANALVKPPKALMEIYGVKAHLPDSPGRSGDRLDFGPLRAEHTHLERGGHRRTGKCGRQGPHGFATTRLGAFQAVNLPLSTGRSLYHTRASGRRHQ